MLQPVLITREDTCFTYAMKRIGLNQDIIDCITEPETIEKYFNLIPFLNKEQFQVGDILYFCKDKRTLNIPIQITGDGIIISHERSIKNHYLVVEENDRVSDCTVDSQIYSYVRSIRMRNIQSIETNPDFILRIKDLKNLFL